MLLLRVLACPLVLFCVEGIGEVVALLTNSNSNRAGEHEHEHRIAAMQEQATLLPRILLEGSEQASGEALAAALAQTALALEL